MVSFPVVVVGVVNTVLALLIAFGVNVTEGQSAAIVAVVNAVLALGAYLWDLRAKKKAAAPPTPPAPATGG